MQKRYDSDMSPWYIYMYLRKDGRSPYYIGKGRGRRAWSKDHTVPLPPTRNRILVIPASSEKIALRREIAFILFYGRKDAGTGILRNRTDGGERGTTGYIPSRDQIDRQRRSLTGYRHSEKTKSKLRAAWKRRGYQRAPFSTTHKRNLSVASLNDTRKILRLQVLAFMQTGTKRPWSRAHKKNHFSVVSPRTRRMNARRKGDPKWIARAREIAERNKKPVRCIETREVFNSRTIAASSKRIPASNISRAIRCGSTAAGFHWKSVL